MYWMITILIINVAWLYVNLQWLYLTHKYTCEHRMSENMKDISLHFKYTLDVCYRQLRVTSVYTNLISNISQYYILCLNLFLSLVYEIMICCKSRFAGNIESTFRWCWCHPLTAGFLRFIVAVMRLVLWQSALY